MHENSPQSELLDSRWEEVRALLPAVRQWMALVAELLGPGVNDENFKTLDCNEDAVALARVVADVSVGPGDSVAGMTQEHHASSVPVEELSIDSDERIRLRSLFKQYEACREKLTAGQWAAVCLRFHDGLKQAQVAVVLKRSRGAVSDRLKRARLRKEAYQRERREEGFLLARKHLNS